MMDLELSLKSSYTLQEASSRINRTLGVDLSEDDFLQLLLDRKINAYLPGEKIFFIVPLSTITFSSEELASVEKHTWKTLSWLDEETPKLSFTFPECVRPSADCFYPLVDLQANIHCSYADDRTGVPKGTLIYIGEGNVGLAFRGSKTLEKHAPYSFDDLYPAVRNFLRWFRAKLKSSGAQLPSQAISNGFSKLDDLVITATEIHRFEQTALGVSEQAPEPEPEAKPMHSRERKSAEQIIAALSAMSGLDLKTPYKAVEPLRAVAARHGLELPASDETIVKFFKGAAEAARLNEAP